MQCGGPFTRRPEGTCRSITHEEVPVDMYGVDRIELCHVDYVDAHKLVSLYPDRVLRVVEGHSIDGIDLVLAIEVGIKRVHHHDQLASRGPALPGVEDEQAGQPFAAGALQRPRLPKVL